MSNDTQATLDPAVAWQQWYDTATNAWTKAVRGETGGYADPMGLYRQWLKGFEAAPGRPGDPAQGGHAQATPDVTEIWKQWLETTTRMWETAAPMGAPTMGWSSQWMEMLEEARARLLAGQRVPQDPLSFAIEWYNATSGIWSKSVADLIGNESFVAMASRFLEGYLSYTKTFRHMAQEFAGTLQLATRQDIARAAGLVVALEDKVDHLEEQLDELTAGYGKLITSGLVPNGALGSVERRLAQMQSTLGERGTVEHRLERVEAQLSQVELATGQLQRTLERLLTTMEKSTDARMAAAKASTTEERKAGTKLPPTSGPAAGQP